MILFGAWWRHCGGIVGGTVGAPLGHCGGILPLALFLNFPKNVALATGTSRFACGTSRFRGGTSRFREGTSAFSNAAMPQACPTSSESASLGRFKVRLISLSHYPRSSGVSMDDRPYLRSTEGCAYFHLKTVPVTYKASNNCKKFIPYYNFCIS